MSRVAVTGARGFVGRAIVAGLVARGHEVHALTSGPAPPDEAGVRWHSVDLMDASATRTLFAALNVSHLAHAAWFTSHGAFWTSDLNYRWVAASLALADAFKSAGGKRIVTVGSCAEYDWRYGFCSETVTPLNPGHPYGVCKVALYRMLEAYAASHGLEFAWARIFYPYGPAEPPARLVSSVILALAADRDAPCSPGTQVRDVLHVSDCGDAIAAAAVSALTGAVNIGSGEPVALRDVIAMIGAKMRKPENIKLAALPMRPDDPLVLIPDVRRLTQEVGWRPRLSLSEGLDQTIAWWQSALPPA